MIRIEKVGEIFYPGVDTEYDKLGIANEFSLELRRASDNSLVENAIPNATFEEIIKSVEAHSFTTDEISEIGSKEITFSSCDMTKGDSFEYNGYYYTIAEITDKIVLKRPLEVEIPSNVTIQNVGNTGIYKIPVQIDEEVLVFCTISHPSFGNAAIKYKIVKSNTSDIINELNNIKELLEETKFKGFT